MSIERKIGKIISILLIAILLLMVIVPFIWLLVSSFKFSEDLIGYPPELFANKYTLGNFVKVFERMPFFRFLLNSIIYAGTVSLISVFIDSMAGYAFARFRFKGRKQLFLLVLITMMVPFQVIMIPLYIEVYKLGILNTYLGLILPRCTSPFGIYLMCSFFVYVPKELEEAGRIDGLSEFKIFLKIMLPLCKPALISLFLFHFMYNWNDLLYPLMMTNSTNMRTLTAGLALFVGARTIQYGPVVAGVVLSILPLMVLFLIAQKYFIKGVAMSGLKE